VRLTASVSVATKVKGLENATNEPPFLLKVIVPLDPSFVVAVNTPAISAVTVAIISVVEI
jgi:hypothetical protein